MKAESDFSERKKSVNIAFFNKWAKSYDNFIFAWWMRILHDEIAKEIPSLPEAKVLDVGCATGALLGKLRKKIRGKLFGVDISPEMIKKASLRLKGIPDTRVELADVEALPFKDGTFDIIVSSLTLHHFPKPHLAMKEMCRVLRENGKLILADSNFFLSTVNHIGRLIEPGFIRMYSKKETGALVKSAGLTLVKQRRAGIFAILTIAVKNQRA